jgi:leader peptidase (prepilin peptidase)/N-methyltransferase
MFPSWSWLLALLIGATLGSFLNMLIYRLPRRLSFVNPPKSFCPKCKHPLGVVDLFPLLSWLSTGGKCRYCKEPVAPRYFLVELLMGGLYAALWYEYLIASYDPVTMTCYMVATAALVAIIFIDWELYIIPDEINAFLLGTGFVYAGVTHTWERALWGAFVGWAILWGIAFFGRVAFGKDAMGHGDIKMMRGVGAIIGPALLIPNMAIAVVAGLVVGLAMIAIAKGKPSAEEEPDETPWHPESVLHLLKMGIFYLLCLDVVGVFWRGIYPLIGEEYEEENIEDDTWQPTLTTIPFGPYLAAGSLVCMIFAGPISKMMGDYWQSATQPAVTRTFRLNFFAEVADQMADRRLTDIR